VSKIHKALEKAQKEREMDSSKDFRPRSLFEEMEIERREILPDSSNLVEMVCDPRMVCTSQYASLAAEQFRKLRTFILQAKTSRPPRTIMVTSATGDEGKTLVAVNLAAGISYDLHSYALLVECDFRDPGLAHWFGGANPKGLSDYLAGDGEISNLLMKTAAEKLRVLPGGGVRENPAELIGSKKMEALIEELKSRYADRYVIFDSPPLLVATEAEILSKWVDGVIIVVRAGMTPREVVRQAISPLEKEKILGFVLNDLKFRTSGLYQRYFGSNDDYYKVNGKDRTKAEPQRIKVF